MSRFPSSATARAAPLHSLLIWFATCLLLAMAVFGYPWEAVAAAGIMTFIVFATHHQNIARLIAGTESRIGQK